MNRPLQRTLPDSKESTGEPAELERAAMALRAQFVEEFRVRRDSSAHHFYKDMVFWPERCRVMYLHEHALAYRSEPDFDKDDLHATYVLRDELGQHLKLFCEELTALMKWFVENLLKMRRDIIWIEGEAEKIWPMLKNEYATWLQIACSGKPADENWQAPGWLNNWPVDLPPKALLSAARGGRLNAHCTTKVLKGIANRIKERLAAERKSALGSLLVHFAQEKEAARRTANTVPHNSVEKFFTAAGPEHAPRRPRRKKKKQLTVRERSILQVLKRNGGHKRTGIVYCHSLELMKIPPRPEWIAQGCPTTYPEAYKLKKWTHRIQDEKYRLSQFLSKSRAHPSPTTS